MFMEKIMLKGKNIVLFSSEESEKLEKFLKSHSTKEIYLGIDKKRLDVFRRKWNSEEISKIISGSKTYVLMDYMARNTKGSEYNKIITIAKKYGVRHVLVDYDYNETVKKSFSTLDIKSKVKILQKIFSGKKSSIDTKIQERFENMAHEICRHGGKTSVAVLDSAHISGVKKFLGKSKTSSSKKTGFSIKSLSFLVPSFIIISLIYGFYSLGFEMVGKVLLIWIVLNFVLAALGALAALAHPATILAAGISSPVTSFIPVLPAGLVAAYVESIFRKPLVKDAEGLKKISLKGIWNNRIAKMGLIFVLVNIGSSTAAYISVAYVFSLLV
jgi:pheromone shutdown protein TraB